MKCHIEHQCKKCSFKKTDKSQTTLGWKVEGGSGSDSGELVPIAFSVETCRQALAEMIILDELPFRHAEGEGFKKFMLVENEEGHSPQRTIFQHEDVASSADKVASRKAKIMAEFKQQLQLKDSLESKSELDRYLAERCEDENDSFDLLIWWKVNSVRYRVLSKVARNVLAIPVSIVASESTFSTVGRVLDPF
ncbi:uncharacterized protein LOC121253405 [Juglans microcarpa x Juglans regia]|uniref:uncharacterized protein LOC121253405 n=1 Tax=Juglans microcarpa x Juglans regia TaxID=2249226 RepID=UPI001B7DF295|nr:uncharacterized protein LOC121253405 [Juglans microcarpa x Juglans regia]